jgi:hypothetical protein
MVADLTDCEYPQQHYCSQPSYWAQEWLWAHVFFYLCHVSFSSAEEKMMKSTKSIFTAHITNNQHVCGIKIRKIPYLR